MSKYRYIDGRQYEQQTDGTWGPTRQQQVMDASRQRAAEQAAAKAAHPVPPPTPRPSNDFATGLILGAVLF